MSTRPQQGVWRMVMAAGLVMGALSPARVWGGSPLEFQEHLIKLVDELKPGVAHIQVELDVDALEDHSSAPPSPYGQGSGFVIDAKGLVLTNYHVVQHAKKIVASFADKQRYTAEIVGYHSRLDLAVLKISPKKPLTAISLGHSERTRVGEFVVAIGSPLGYSHSVTFGMVSAIGRLLVRPTSRLPNLIQTDCPINRGNSGGPLINMNGEVIGVNSMIAGGEGNIGLGFAIPADEVKRLLPRLLSGEENDDGQPFVGVTMGQVYDMEAGEGVQVTGLSPRGPAQRAGIKVGDRITRVDGKVVNDFEEFASAIAHYEVGKTIGLTVVIKGGRHPAKLVKVKLAEMPSFERAVNASPEDDPDIEP